MSVERGWQRSLSVEDGRGAETVGKGQRIDANGGRRGGGDGL